MLRKKGTLGELPLAVAYSARSASITILQSIGKMEIGELP